MGENEDATREETHEHTETDRTEVTEPAESTEEPPTHGGPGGDQDLDESGHKPTVPDA